MIESILPPQVVAVESRDDDDLDGVLFPEEEALVARAVDKRRKEFAAARICARRALALLGRPPAPILSGSRGEPLWPDGIVGSITHCAGYRGAVAAVRSEVASIGIDAEPDGPLPDGVLDAVALPEESVLVRERAGQDGVHWDRLLFCAKEAVYKTWYPLTGRWLGFEEARIDLVADPAPAVVSGTESTPGSAPAPAPGSAPGSAPAPAAQPGGVRGSFSARLLVPGPQLGGRTLQDFSGRWLAADGLILTAIVLPWDDEKTGG
ncbi:4'-phosphopantetheinyl transferase superfamily protein [Nonomuraea sp. N2-4H]|uniref:4'-phosphopantetheinyl transferase family protein n=1 Tax=Nonomuraea sp. N2-4H TaxID=3128898 RepID=UPI00324AFA7C